MTTVAHSALAALKESGVDRLFGIPGGGPTLIEACIDASGYARQFEVIREL